MTTTAEENKWTYVDVPGAMCSIIDPEGREIGYGDIHEDDAKRLTDMLNELKKLREEEVGELEVTDEMIGKWVQHYVDLINNKDGTTNFDCTQVLRWFKDAKYDPAIYKLSRKIAQLQAEKDVLIETVRKDTEQIGKLQAEKERMREALKLITDASHTLALRFEACSISDDEAEAECFHHYDLVKSLLASLPGEKG